MKLVEDFYNKVMYNEGGLATTYFPDYMTNNSRKYQQLRYAVECFSNGCLSKQVLVKRVARACGTEESEVSAIIDQYIVEQ